jgi:hypothetical protein
MSVTLPKRFCQIEELQAMQDEAGKKLDELKEAGDDALESRVDNEWDQMTQTAREKARANLKTLRQQRNELAEWYGSFKNSSAGAWEQMKKGFSDAYQAMSDAWEKAQSEFDSDNN